MKRVELDLRRRYLIPFHAKRTPHVFTDVLVIGGGIAGIRAAMAASEKQQVLLVTKDTLQQSNSAYAQGGIAGVLDPLDDVAHHVADTLAAGKGLCDESVVGTVCSEAADQIRELIAFGAQFDLANGELELTREGGHSRRRVAHALGDATGKEIMRAMVSRVLANPAIEIWERTFTVDLLTFEGRCCGALVSNSRYGRTFVWAKQTVIATGGAGRLYRETTNPDIATADGHAAAFRAGVVLRDMEFMQFHPTVLYIAGSSRYLISEALRGEGAYLRDGSGTRFMADSDPRMELAPRDVVSQAITRQMQKSNHPCVYLDMTHCDRDVILKRFPHISRVCLDFGIDIANDLIPVRPGAHYMMGGVVVDQDARTSVPGLWAAGEVTSSGLHGANRLGSNSLLEGLVFGLRAGCGAAAEAETEADRFAAQSIESPDWKQSAEDEQLNVDDIRNALASLMWRDVGIERHADKLQSAAQQVEFWNHYVANRTFHDPMGWELQNMLTVARLMITAALSRTESRGVHFRSDFPAEDPGQAEHILLAVSADSQQAEGGLV